MGFFHMLLRDKFIYNQLNNLNHYENNKYLVSIQFISKGA